VRLHEATRQKVRERLQKPTTAGTSGESTAVLKASFGQLTQLYSELGQRKRFEFGVNQIWRFVRELKVGDIVAEPTRRLQRLIVFWGR